VALSTGSVSPGRNVGCKRLEDRMFVTQNGSRFVVQVIEIIIENSMTTTTDQPQ